MSNIDFIKGRKNLGFLKKLSRLLGFSTQRRPGTKFWPRKNIVNIILCHVVLYKLQQNSQITLKTWNEIRPVENCITKKAKKPNIWTFEDY